jgi:hypothetical protein
MNNGSSNPTMTFDGLLEHCARIEALAGRYVYEAHNQSLDGLDICEHEAGICFCSYHASLRRLLEALTNSPIKRPLDKIECTYDGQLDKIGNDLIWTQKLKVLDGELRETKARYELLKELTYSLISSNEIHELQQNGSTHWQDRPFFEGLLERIHLHLGV